ncbi:MAG: thrombospondin type 3 repeat-containing protein [Pseudomonadales bacterium]|nr:thrombospondin type 3 repeat-containing protein [Pseudomonadales bacterium]
MAKSKATFHMFSIDAREAHMYKDFWIDGRGRQISVTACLFLLTTVLGACGDGGGGATGVPDAGNDAPPILGISGSPVDGPMAGAAVSVYRVDTAASGLRGALLDEGETNARAALSGLEIAESETGPLLIEVTADADTIDLTTGEAPIIAAVKTVVPVSALSGDVYATPLTTMAVDLAVAKLDDAGSFTTEELLAELRVAATEVTSTFGFGMDEAIDIFTTPPLITDATDTPEEQARVAAYRTAVSGVAAVVFEIQRNTEGATIGGVLAGLADDLSDGDIDGTNSENAPAGGYDADDAAVIVETDPSHLMVPGTNKTVQQTEELLDAETGETGTTSDTSDLADGTIDADARPAVVDTDRDRDGVLNVRDAFPNDPTESVDTDGDGVGNNADNDDDNDGVVDVADAFPLDASESADTDGDGTGNHADTDDDGDGVDDSADDFPLDAARSDATDEDGDGWPAEQDPDDTDAASPGFAFVDTDGDGVGDGTDEDDDNDGVNDSLDGLPLDPSETSDSDGDGFGDLRDDDIDGDGVPNHSGGDGVLNTRANRVPDGDAFPFDPSESADFDGDGVGDNLDADADGDGLADVNDPDPRDPDSDDDGVKDGRDALPEDPAETLDSDGDGVGNNADNCRFRANANQVDTDGDGLGNACDSDDDGDGVADVDDAFPLDPQASSFSDADGDGWPAGQDPDDADADVPALQYVDTDGDGLADNGGLVADTDDDNDGYDDTQDAFPLNAQEFRDSDQDGIGDVADTDDDDDGVADALDAFPFDAGESADTDRDGFGDNVDNCPLVAGPQRDTDSDGLGDACDPDDDNDGVADAQDAFPRNALESRDTDGDGVGDRADMDDDGDTVSDVEEAARGTNPLLRDSDHDGVHDGLDNCPTVANGDQRDADGDGIGNLCDDPPEVAGFYRVGLILSGTTRDVASDAWAATARRACTESLLEREAGVVVLEQTGSQVRFSRLGGRIVGSRVADGAVSVLGDVASRVVADWPLADGTSVHQIVTLQGRLVRSSGEITGRVLDERTVGAADGTTAVRCTVQHDVTLSPMPAANAAAVLDAAGADGGFVSLATHDGTDSVTGVTVPRFEYSVVNTTGQEHFLWRADTDQWQTAGPDDVHLMLTTSGWVPAREQLEVTAASAEQAEVVRRDTGGRVVERWLVNVFASGIADQPMAYLVDRRWVDSGFEDVTAVFAEAASRSLAIEAVSQQASWAIACGALDASTGVGCLNGVPTGGVDAAGLPAFAHTFADLIIPAGQTTAGVARGIPVAATPGGAGTVLAFLHAGANATAGEVSFGSTDVTGQFVVITQADGTPLTVGWSLVDPLSTGLSALRFDIPELIRRQFEDDGETPHVFLAVVEDPVSGVAQVRIGRLTPAGSRHREAGLNLPALDEVKTVFDYQPPVPPDTDGDGVADVRDAFPGDATEWADFDGDGTGDNADLDDDGDGVADSDDAYPFDPTRSVATPSDFDGDGIADDVDDDDDNDGVPDAQDPAPFDPNIGPVQDRDGDGVADALDNCLIVFNADQLDSDGDLLGDACDVAVADLRGRWSITVTPSSGSEVPGATGLCEAEVAHTVEADFTMVGNQVFAGFGDPAGTTLSGVLMPNGAFGLMDAVGAFSMDTSYNPASDSFSGGYSGLRTAADGTSCQAFGSITGERSSSTP